MEKELEQVKALIKILYPSYTGGKIFLKEINIPDIDKRFKGKDNCKYYFNFEKKEIEIYAYKESYHNGGHYDCENGSIALSKEILELLIFNLKPKVILELKHRLEQEEKDKFLIKAKQIVNDILK